MYFEIALIIMGLRNLFITKEVYLSSNLVSLYHIDKFYRLKISENP